MRTVISENDAALVAAALDGCLDSFGELVSRYESGVRSFLVVRMRGSHEADDLAQEVFLIAHKKLAEYDSDLPLQPWLRGIADNLLRNHLRKRRPTPIGGEAEIARLIDTQISLEFQAEMEPGIFAALDDCLEKLDGESRRLLLRRYRDDADIRDLCDDFELNHSTVTMRLYRLREVLGACIKRTYQKS